MKDNNKIIEKLKEIIKHLERYIFASGDVRGDLWESKKYKLESELAALESEQTIEEKGEKKPEIVCICGSGRFLKEMHYVEERLTLEGKIVLMIGVNTKDVARTENMEQYKPMLDELHLRKIDLSDRVFVVNVGGYIGESTRKEINYSESHNKPIEYLESETIGKSISSSGILCSNCNEFHDYSLEECYRKIGRAT